MCEANVYIRENKESIDELLMEAVDKIVPDGDNIILESIFGHRKIVKARIAEMALLDHRIVLERN